MSPAQSAACGMTPPAPITHWTWELPSSGPKASHFHLVVQLCINSLTSLSPNSLIVSKHCYNNNSGLPGHGRLKWDVVPGVTDEATFSFVPSLVSGRRGQAFRRQWNAGGVHRSVQYIEVCGVEHTQQAERRGHMAGPAVVGRGSISLWMRPLIPTIRGALCKAEAWPPLHLGWGAGAYSWLYLPCEALKPEAGSSSWVPCLWARPWLQAGG